MIASYRHSAVPIQSAPAIRRLAAKTSDVNALTKVKFTNRTLIRSRRSFLRDADSVHLCIVHRCMPEFLATVSMSVKSSIW